jgi:hypothetical protein
LFCVPGTHTGTHKLNEANDALQCQFLWDISRYITGSKVPTVEIEALFKTLPSFITLSNIVIADSFGDHKAVAKMESEFI